MNAALVNRPKLRWPLDTEAYQQGGESYLILRDPLGVASKPAMIPSAVVPVISRFEGIKSVAEIAGEGAAYGITVELVQKLANELELLGFLETEETVHELKALCQEFYALPLRPPALAGLVYPAAEESLSRTLNGYIAGAETGLATLEPGKELLAVICPHIDYQRGWKTYASAYSTFREIADDTLIFLFGTSHSGGESLFQLTKKDFNSPNGVLYTDVAVVERLASAYNHRRAFQDEFLHKQEHSLELQVPFLLHAFRDRKQPPKIVPILVGSFHELLSQNNKASEHGELGEFVNILSELIVELRAQGRKLLLYGAIDLSHMGRFFGDSDALGDAGCERVKSRDRELLDSILAADSEGLFRHIAEDRDLRKICGFPSIYTMLAAAERAGILLTGSLLEYRQAYEPTSDCLVSFASAYWTA